MNSSDIAVATITLVRTSSEEALIRRALARLSRFGMPVFVADGGSGRAFLDYADALPAVSVSSAPSGGGLIAQVRASVGAAVATGRRFVLYTEPDKAAFFEQGLADFLRHAPDDGAGVVVASRSEASFGTFPRMQQLTEGTFNRLCGELTGDAGDYLYGPFVFRPELAPPLGRLPADIGWGWRPFLFAFARRRGLQVRHVAGDYECPPEQREETAADRVHRMRQLVQNINGLVLALTTDPE